jgi:phospholipase/lecithinase/hemolysin
MHDASRPKSSIALFPIGDRMRSIINHPAQFGMTDVSHPCQPTLPKPAAVCSSPDTFLWWDELHPSARTHQILAKALAASLMTATAR